MSEQVTRHELSHWFRLLMRKTMAEYGRSIQEGLSTSQYTMLTILRSEGQRSCSELAERINVSLPAVTNLANKLVDRGLAERVQNGVDRRTVLLRATELGRQTLSTVDCQANRVLESFWAKLSGEEVEQLTRLLSKALN